MKTSINILIAMIIIFSGYSNAQANKAFIGDWITAENDTIRIYEHKQNIYHAKIIGLEKLIDEEGKPLEGESYEVLKSKCPFINIDFIINLKPQGKDKLVDGKLLIVWEDEEYNCSFELIDKNTIRFVIHTTFLDQVEAWKRLR